jgi:O-antigen ligase
VVIVWQVPHTIVLRYALLVGLGLLAWPVAVARLVRPAAASDRRARLPFWALAAFLLWSAAVALFVSPSASASMTDLRAEWLAPTLILLLGYGLALRYPEEDAVVRVIFLGCLLHSFMVLVTVGIIVFHGDPINLEKFGGIGDHRANVTYTNTIGLAILIADVAARARGAAGFLRIGTRWAVAAFALLLASTIVATTRNGLVVFALMCVLGFLLVAGEFRVGTSRKAWVTLVACGLFTLAGTLGGLKAEPRWSNFIATAPVAWDTHANQQWLQGERVETGLPMTSAGKPVEPSAYFRIAYLREGLELLLEHPWGTRVGRDAFRLAVVDKFGRGGMSHAHNGFIDVGVSLGFPGLALWIAFLASFVGVVARVPEAAGSGVRGALLLVIIGFAARTMVDATVRDHILQEYMLTMGALLGSIAIAGAANRA